MVTAKKKEKDHVKPKSKKKPQMKMREARIRTVKPELFNHEGLFDAEMAEGLPLRVAFIALFTCCDREGRFRWQPRRLKLDMLPYDEVDISRVLHAFVTRGFILKYECNGEMYGCIPSWSRHQKVNSKEVESSLPPPEGFNRLALEEPTPLEPENTNRNKQITMHDSSVTDACVTRDARRVHFCDREGKGREVKEREEEEEGNGREGEANETIVASLMRPRLSMKSATQQIFEHWKTVMRHPDAKLDHKRKALIGKALNAGYDIEQLCHAISGCSVTPHNMGDNDRNQRYDGLHVILRDADQIDRFVHHYHYPPHPVSEAERRAQANVHTLQRWVNKKMEEETFNGNA